MRFYNVIQAAAYIGCDPKTVRRWLKRGRLTAERTERGWLAIPGGQVEYAKIQWEKEQEQFAGPRMPRDVQVVPDGQHKDMMDRVGRLGVVIDSLSTKVAALEERIASLEQAMSNASLPVPTLPMPSSPDLIPPKAASTSPIPADLPSGTLHSSDFAAQLGITKTVMEGWLKNGVVGEELERTKIPIAARPGQNRNYFTPQQQQKAVELLKKHGKLE